MAGILKALKKESTLTLVLMLYLYSITSVKATDQGANHATYQESHNETQKLLHGLWTLRELNMSRLLNLNKWNGSAYSQTREELLALTTALEETSSNFTTIFKEAANEWINNMDLIHDLLTLGRTLRNPIKNIRKVEQPEGLRPYVPDNEERCGWLNHHVLDSCTQINETNLTDEQRTVKEFYNNDQIGGICNEDKLRLCH